MLTGTVNITQLQTRIVTLTTALVRARELLRRHEQASGRYWRRKFRGCQAITTARKSPAFRARTAMTIAKAGRDSRRTLKLIANLLAEAQ